MLKTCAYYILICCCCLFSIPIIAQETPTNLWIENIETLAMELEDTNWEDELEELSYYVQNPINLNAASKQQLEIFPFLSDKQIENLLSYIYIHGQMESIYELQMVQEMDKRTIELLLPFVCVSKIEEDRGYPNLKDILKYGKHEFLTRFDFPLYTRKGYQSAYLGPKQYHSLRYQFRYGEYVQAGISGEKDAGEPFFALHNKKGYDHYSYYIQLKQLGCLENLVIGTYRLSFGQGLVLGNNFALGKSYTLTTSDYRATGIRKHASTDEYNYFRGIAATMRLHPRLKTTLFYSHRSMDGTIKDGAITSIDKAGLHRTSKEVEKANSFTMQTTGGNINYDYSHLQLGVTGIYYFFNRPYSPALRKYAKHNLQGNNFYNIGLDYQYRFGGFNLSGEVAKGKKGIALINRLSYRFSPDYRIMLIHRLYKHNYWAFFASSFGESSTPQNENGWYVATEATPWANWRFFASMDFFSFPWWKYRISKPSQGFDGMLQATYTATPQLGMTLNYRIKRKERDVTGTSGELIYPTWHHRMRYRLNYTSPVWQLRTTIDYNLFKHQNTETASGYIITQQATYTLPQNPVCSITLQGSYFHTDDYDARVYAYEKGLLNTFYTPSFYGRGFRYSAHVRYEAGKHLLFLLKFGQTIYQDRQTISSDNDMIESNKKSDLQLQVRIKF